MKFILGAVLLFIAGCAGQAPYTKPLLSDQGEVFLYARPFPQQASRLNFVLQNISALREDGLEVPLSPAITKLDSGKMNRQRLLASGALPPGNYVALSFKVKTATLQGEEGEALLLLPQEAVRSEASFTVTGKKALFLSLDFNYGESVRDGFAFTPVFRVTAPGKPVSGLVGYVANAGANTLTLFDRQANEVVGVIATGRAPRCVVVDQQRRRAYVALSADSSIQVFDTAGGEAIGTIPLHPGAEPVELALASEGRLLLSVNSASNTLSFIDPLALAEMDKVAVDAGPSALVVDPAGTRAFVFNDVSNTISVIDVHKRLVISTMASQPGPSRGEFNRRGDLLHVIHSQSTTLDTIDPFSLTLQQSRNVGAGMSLLRLDSATDLFYGTRRLSAGIELFEPFSFMPLAFIATAGEPVQMVMDREQHNLYAVIPATRTVQVINAVSRNVIAEFDVDDDSAWVALAGTR